MIGPAMDREGLKDSENAPNSIFSKINESPFWRFVTDVYFKPTWIYERRFALRAPERFFSSVNSDVNIQSMLRSKSFIAHFTLERFFACVD